MITHNLTTPVQGRASVFSTFRSIASQA